MVVFVRKAWLVFFCLFLGFVFVCFLLWFCFRCCFSSFFCSILGSFCARWQHFASSSSDEMKRLHHLVIKALTQVAP